MPGACAKGTFAYIAIRKVPKKEIRQVAKNTPFWTCAAYSACPMMLKGSASMVGLTTMMYAIATKVEKPATTAIFTLVWFFSSSK